MRMLRRPSLRCVPSLSLITLAFCLSTAAQETPIDGIADRLAQQLQKAEKKHFTPRVLVVDFPLRPGGINALGEYLADQLTDALAQKIGPAAVIDRKQFRTDLQSGGISPFNLADRDIATWISGQVGANTIVFGEVTTSEERLLLSVDLIRILDEKKLASSKVDIPLSGNLKEMLSKPLDWPASPDVIVPCLAGPREEMPNVYKTMGVTVPACIRCPDPEYTDEARRAKAQGTVKFDVVVDQQGSAKHITVVKGDKYGFTARAIGAIKTWKFKPAMKDGKPVTVCVVIEVSFRLY